MNLMETSLLIKRNSLENSEQLEIQISWAESIYHRRQIFERSGGVRDQDNIINLYELKKESLIYVCKRDSSTSPRILRGHQALINKIMQECLIC